MKSLLTTTASLRALLATGFIAASATAATPCGDCLTEFFAYMQQEQTKTELPEFNKRVLDAIAAYPTDGTHDYWWPRAGESNYDGVSTNVTFQGQTILKGEEGGRTYCCGLTLQVFFDAYKAHLAENGGEETATLKASDIARFKQLWFVQELMGPGPSAALEAYGLGKEIKPEEALPGDFVQLWRESKSGHSVVFLEWVEDDAGEIIGIKYWSTQTSTKGINENIEYFSRSREDGKGMVWDKTYYARVEL